MKKMTNFWGAKDVRQTGLSAGEEKWTCVCVLGRKEVGKNQGYNNDIQVHLDMSSFYVCFI